MRINDEPGYVLKRQDYGDTSLLVDVFTRHQGRCRLIVKGAKSGRAEKARILQPFQKLLFGWTGRSELKTLTQVESVSNLSLAKESMACAFYLNELLWHFLEIQDPHDILFDSYESTLNVIAEDALLEPPLRQFEFLLLQEIGYGLSFDVDSDSGEQIVADKHYIYHVDRGLVGAGEDQEYAVSGEIFIALANDDFSQNTTLKLAKRIARQAISHRLDGRELHSRKWFRQEKQQDA